MSPFVTMLFIFSKCFESLVLDLLYVGKGYYVNGDIVPFVLPKMCGRASASGAGGQCSIPCQVISTTFAMVVMAAHLGAQGCEVSITTDCLVSG